jgi:hypothetical protein
MLLRKVGNYQSTLRNIPEGLISQYIQKLVSISQKNQYSLYYKITQSMLCKNYIVNYSEYYMKQIHYVGEP